MIALLEARKAGLFQRRFLLQNLVAGAIVGVVALPLAMAFAIASGVRPEAGLYTAIVAGAAVAAFGGTRLQIAGPTGAFVAILASVTATYGVRGLQIATLMAGVILVIMGLARLGRLISFIPMPVIVGFTAGIGVIIVSGQWRYFAGLPIAGGEAHASLAETMRSNLQVHVPTLALAVASLVVLVGAPRVPFVKKIPAPLLAMVAATAIAMLFPDAGFATLGTAFGEIPRGFPMPSIPAISMADLKVLLAPAFTIAMLGAIESLLSAVVADDMAGTRHDSNQELIGQGIANVVAPMFGGFAATGAIARTATNVRSGANSPIAGLVHTGTLLAILLALAPLASAIPLAALAAILFIVAWNMSDLPRFFHIARRAPFADRVILFVTFLLTVFVDLVTAVNVGVVLAVLHFLRRMARAVEVHPDASARVAAALAERPAGIAVYEIVGPVFFAAADRLEQELAGTSGDVKAIVVRMRHVPFVDMTGISALEGLAASLAKGGIGLFLCEANPLVQKKLEGAGSLQRFPGMVQHSLLEALDGAAAGLQ